MPYRVQNDLTPGWFYVHHQLARSTSHSHRVHGPTQDPQRPRPPHCRGAGADRSPGTDHSARCRGGGRLPRPQGARMHVEVGQDVSLGQVLFEDRTIEGVRHTAPGAGRVVAINRGARRVLQSVVIELAKTDTVEPAVVFDTWGGGAEQISEDAIRALLVESGQWTAIRARPTAGRPAGGPLRYRHRQQPAGPKPGRHHRRTAGGLCPGPQAVGATCRRPYVPMCCQGFFSGPSGRPGVGGGVLRAASCRNRRRSHPHTAAS